MKTLLLTGATGFLGGHLLKGLIEKNNYKIIILKRSFSDVSKLGSLIDKVKAYNIDEINISQVFKENDINIIIHCATNYGRKTHSVTDMVEANLLLPLNLLQQGLNYNLETFINTDTIIDKRINDYSLSKNQFKEWLIKYSEKIRAINLALEHFYGPNDDETKFVTYLINEFINNVPNIELTKGTQKRDFIYIDDVISGFIKILENLDNIPRGFNHFEMASGKNITIKDFVNLVKNISQNTSTKLGFGAKPERKNEVMEYSVDISKLLNLGWKPKFSLEEGLKLTIKAEKNKRK